MAATITQALVQYKVAVIGAAGSGKSCLVNRFVANVFTEAWEATADDEYAVTLNVNGTESVLEVVDTAGHGNYTETVNRHIFGAQGVILVFSVVDRNSFAALDSSFLPHVTQLRGNSGPFPILVVGTKADLQESRTVSRSDSYQWAQKIHAPYIEVSSKTGHNIQQAFIDMAVEISDIRTRTFIQAPLVRAPDAKMQAHIQQKFSTWKRFKSFFGLGNKTKNNKSPGTSRKSLTRSSISDSSHDTINPSFAISTSEVHASCLIDSADLEMDDSIVGKGGFGVVRRGKWQKTVDVAVKSINNLPEFTTDVERAEFYQEIKMLSEMRHPNILQMYGYCEINGSMCLLTEFMKGGDLNRYIFVNPPLSSRKIAEVGMSICAGMIYLHNTKKLIHRDLKPGNLLVGDWPQSTIKVCDFGLSKVKTQDEAVVTGGGVVASPAYSAPDLADANHSRKVDMYSFGIMLWEMCTGQHVWSDAPSAFAILSSVAQGKRPPAERIADEALRGLIVRCWDQNPAVRPEFADIYPMLEQVVKSVPGLGSAARPKASPKITQMPRPKMPGPNTQVMPYPYPNAGGVRSEYGGVAENLGAGANASVDIVSAARSFFGNAEWRPTDAFCRLLEVSSGSPGWCVQSIMHAFVDDSGQQVSRTTWDKFVKWFVPLVREDADRTGAYTLSRVASIVGRPDFHGFLDSDSARRMLELCPPGTYLFRFSTSSKCLAASASYAGGVSHWRFVMSDPDNTSDRFLSLEDHRYRSLDHVVEIHSQSGGSSALQVAGSGQSLYFVNALRRR